MIYLDTGIYDNSTNFLFTVNDFTIYEHSIYFDSTNNILYRNDITSDKIWDYEKEFKNNIKPLSNEIFKYDLSNMKIFDSTYKVSLDTTHKLLTERVINFINNIAYYNEYNAQHFLSFSNPLSIIPYASFIVIRKCGYIVNTFLFKNIYYDNSIFKIECENALNKYLITFSTNKNNYDNIFITATLNNNETKFKPIKKSNLCKIKNNDISNLPPTAIQKIDITNFKIKNLNINDYVLLNSKYFCKTKNIIHTDIDTTYLLELLDFSTFEILSNYVGHYFPNDFTIIDSTYYLILNHFKTIHDILIELDNSNINNYNLFIPFIQHVFFYEYLTPLDITTANISELPNLIEKNQEITYSKQYNIMSNANIKLKNLSQHFYDNQEYLISDQTIDKSNIYYNNDITFQIYFSDNEKLSFQLSYLKYNSILPIIENKEIGNEILILKLKFFKLPETNLLDITCSIINYDYNQYNDLTSCQITNDNSIIILQPIHLYNIYGGININTPFNLKNFILNQKISFGGTE